MVDETEEKYRNGEITYGEMCKKFNWANDDTYKREKIDEILNKIVKKNVNGDVVF